MSHSHEHSASTAPRRALTVALAITATVFFVEFVGGYISGSMALMADSMHMLSDSAGLLIAVIGTLLSQRASTAVATYGFARAEVLTALVNAVSVIAVTVLIVLEAFSRLHDPAPVDTGAMMVFAVVGLVANAASAAMLHRHKEESINVHGAFLHVIVDLLGSIAVLAAGAVMAVTGFTPADAIASLIIAALVVPRAWQLLRQSLRVLLEQAPQGFAAQRIKPALRAIDGVIDVHDIHVWSLGGSDVVVTAHLVAHEDVPRGPLLDAAQKRLTDLGVDHPTIQVELPGHTDHERACGVSLGR
ncbi:cation diffusion facilitator family transporter [Corynebacterium sanguinis]|uniref:cation diffusion facilitator family transporter n=1 Tax=Corynebacterium sanguinis TaxID=2594913 RepID=UPI00223AC02F|nr:cation diffusion facilitator family transporter [Corynebacterium sanguinis]MCT2289051.1 cation diffusion facilitator family transporter [Corynebacterium sanguinis]